MYFMNEELKITEKMMIFQRSQIPRENTAIIFKHNNVQYTHNHLKVDLNFHHVSISWPLSCTSQKFPANYNVTTKIQKT